ncbi:MAG: 16S rRNA (cytosine(1402)-N(4))-methyltransferase RsmH [Oscillospiraceae bacterium]|nr:16S rRNA (cytosine(1402)-N(4))-methyltransferase RsmH [Oscillospiraceae bacterium]
MEATAFSHIPVMPDQCMEALAIRPDGLYVDATLGAGGHARRIAEQLRGGKLIGIDKDPQALARAAGRLADYQGTIQLLLLRGDYRDMDKLLAAQGIHQVDGILFDCGVSSPQFDDPSRGFSYRFPDAPLDMRMDPDAPLSAYDIVNGWPAEKLKAILHDYGEEVHASLITAAIEKKRSHTPILTTGQLASIVVSALPPAARRGKGHPAKRSFQAIRVAVNDELAGLKTGLVIAIGLLSPGGRLVAISFHSGEDRIVKTVLRDAATGCKCPPDFPVCVCGKTPTIKPVYRKHLAPNEDELAHNRRAKGAKLRAAEKIV